MIKSFYTIGKVLSQDENFAEYFEPWANPFPKVKGDEAKVIFAQIENGVLVDELTEEIFSKKRIDSYLYRKVQGANGTNLVPTLLLQMESNFDKYSDNVRKLIKKVKQSILNNKHTFINTSQIDTIEQKLIAFHGFMSNDKRYLFSMKIDNKYFGDFEEYKELFREEAYSKYYKDSSAQNKVCSVTYQPSKEVWGRVDTLGFTVDAISFARNGFDVAESYKMFPVSPEAVKVLEGAKRIIIDSELNLTKNFYGLKYFVLPRFIIEDDAVIDRTLRIFLDNPSTEQSIEEEKKRLINSEAILHRIAEKHDILQGVYFDIFFFQPNNAQFLIKLHLSDVLPSQFVKIFRVKEEIERRYSKLNDIIIKIKNKKSENITLKYYITFGGIYQEKMPPIYGIKDYFSQKVRTDTIFHPFFYKVLESIFYNTPLNKVSVLKAFMEKIWHAFKNLKENSNDFDRHVKTSFTIYQFFNELNLFGNNMEELEKQEVKSGDKVGDFISKHQDFFTLNEPARLGAFYVGCCTSKMLYIQKKYYDLDNEYKAPFLKNLQNMNFNLKDLNSLFTKLHQYIKYTSKISEKGGVSRFDFKEIEELLSKAGHHLSSTTNLSRVELSYAFTLGMTMHKSLALEAYKLSKETNQNN